MSPPYPPIPLRVQPSPRSIPVGTALANDEGTVVEELARPRPTEMESVHPRSSGCGTAALRPPEAQGRVREAAARTRVSGGGPAQTRVRPAPVDGRGGREQVGPVPQAGAAQAADRREVERRGAAARTVRADFAAHHRERRGPLQRPGSTAEHRNWRAAAACRRGRGAGRAYAARKKGARVANVWLSTICDVIKKVRWFPKGEWGRGCRACVPGPPRRHHIPFFMLGLWVIFHGRPLQNSCTGPYMASGFFAGGVFTSVMFGIAHLV